VGEEEEEGKGRGLQWRAPSVTAPFQRGVSTGG
jgi:hypothetical protein